MYSSRCFDLKVSVFSQPSNRVLQMLIYVDESVEIMAARSVIYLLYIPFRFVNYYRVFKKKKKDMNNDKYS